MSNRPPRQSIFNTVALPLFGALLALTPHSAGALESEPSGSLSTAADVKRVLSADSFAESEISPDYERGLRAELADDFAYTPTLRRRLRFGGVGGSGWSGGFGGLSRSRSAAVSRQSRRAAIVHMAQLQRRGFSPATQQAYDIPLYDHPLVDEYITYFSGRGRGFFTRWLQRAERYKPLMQPLFAKAGVPLDTVYLAMIESGFSSRALSSAKAAGFWQFIGSTATRFRLKRDFWIDERRDFIRATEAAIAYLKQLHGRFGDWHLAWAAYNAGGGRISRALKRTGTTDFWSLIDNHPGVLAEETRRYVPKMLAATIIAKNPDYFGFDDVVGLSLLSYDEIVVKGSVDLRLLARHLGAKHEHLKTLNPALLHGMTPPARGRWRQGSKLRVPKGSGKKVQRWIASLPPSRRVRGVPHRIARGDTLWEISKQYGVSIRAISELNGIDSPSFIKPGQVIMIPSPAGTRKTGRAQHKPGRHVVRKGETLWSIARRYNVSVGELKRWNGRRSSLLQPGDILALKNTR